MFHIYQVINVYLNYFNLIHKNIKFASSAPRLKKQPIIKWVVCRYTGAAR